VLNRLKHILRLSFERSPKENLKRLSEKLHRNGSDRTLSAEVKTDLVLPDLEQQPAYQQLIVSAFRFRRSLSCCLVVKRKSIV